jgi:hypothetical protein
VRFGSCPGGFHMVANSLEDSLEEPAEPIIVVYDQDGVRHQSSPHDLSKTTAHGAAQVSGRRAGSRAAAPFVLSLHSPTFLQIGDPPHSDRGQETGSCAFLARRCPTPAAGQCRPA